MPEPQVSAHIPKIPAGIPEEQNNLLAQALPPQKFPSSGPSAGNSRRWEGNPARNEHPKSTQAAPPRAPGPGFWGVPSGGTGMARRADFPPRSRCSRERKGNQSYFGRSWLLFPPPGIPGVGIFTDPRKTRGVSCCHNRDGTREFLGWFLQQKEGIG